MKIAGVGNQNGSTGAQWPGVPKIAKDEFQQSFAVARLAVELCKLKKAQSNVPLEKENLEDQAWELIKSAREHVLRPQSNAEYFVAHGGSHEAAENVVGRIPGASRVPFEKLCDPERHNKGDTEIIKLLDAETGKTIEVEWKVYRSERAFDKLFWDYWREKGEKRDTDAWKKHGKSLLDSWKKDGVPPNTFLALASGYFDFERGVKVITGETRLDRALPSLRRFLKSRFADEDMAERAMADYREKRFAPQEPYLLKDEFAKWKRREKSRNARRTGGRWPSR